uniref:G_PROTEIN_RECEP_F1_2 domain-containing protein n=1 Tax=Steinernema glaseri TaxID=37863 RepID=A0A1I7YN31_9BILA
MTIDYNVFLPEFSFNGSVACLPSTYLGDRFVPALHGFLNICLFGQWQLLMLTLLYAVTLICWPHKIHLHKSMKMVPFAIFFTLLPGCLLLCSQLAVYANDVCIDFSPRATFYIYGGTAVGYMIAYTGLSIYLLLKIGSKLKNGDSVTSAQTIRLVKSVRRNFLSLVVLVIFLDLLPLMSIMSTYFFIGASEAQGFIVLIFRYTSISASVYPLISTLITIAVTKPYRRRSMKLFRTFTQKSAITQSVQR